MKRFLAMVMALVMALTMAACGPKTPPAASSTPESSSSSQTPDANDVWMPFDENGKLKLNERDAVGENGMVTSANVYATQAGLKILEQGGNAIDAAAAVSYALGVVEPNASGLGGGGFFIIHTADGKDAFIDYREVASKNQDAYTWLGEDGKVKEVPCGHANHAGGLATGVPGTVAGMELAVEKYGSGKVTREQIMQPAIDLATNGYIMGPSTANAITDHYEDMVSYEELGSYFLNPETGLPYETGDHFANPDLAATLTKIAKEGKDAFYTGEIAQAIVDTVAKYGGVMTLDDLANYTPAERTPVTGTYRGYKIISAPPSSSGGTHLIEILNIMENYDVAGLGLHSPEVMHLWSEAFKIAFADRAAYMADTDFKPDVPLEGLTSKEYAKERVSKIVEGKSQDWDKGEPFNYGHDSTTSFSIADKEGNIVTVTQTIECFFGSKMAIKGYGFVMNDQMHDFSTDPESVNKLEGGKRPLSSMSPTIVLDENDKAFMAVGSPGGVRIFPTVAQVISNVIDHGMDIQEAIDTARMWDNGTDKGLCYESGGVNPVSAETAKALDEMGHTTVDKGEWNLFFGGVQGILFNDDGTIHGGADPRRDGKAMGF